MRVYVHVQDLYCRKLGGHDVYDCCVSVGLNCWLYLHGIEEFLSRDGESPTMYCTIEHYVRM